MHRCLPFAASLILLGCANSPDSADKNGDAVQLTPIPTADAIHYSVPINAGPSDLARLAIRHQPSIAAARYRAERLAQKAPQERSLPDPMIEISAGSMAETAAGRVEAVGGVKQNIPFPGKRREAAAAADREAAAAQAEITALELKLTEQVHNAWWDLYLAHRTLEFTRESSSYLKTIQQSVDARVATAQATQSDQIRISNELALLDSDLAEAENLRITAVARLNSLLNRPSGAALTVSENTPIVSLGSLQTLLERARSQHPEVAAAEERAQAFRHRLKRAELEKYPDFTVGISGASVADSGLAPSANGRDQIFGTLGINIPIWQEPRRAMIREARAGIAETEAMIAATRSDLRYRIEDAWYSATTAREIVGLFETRLVPESKQAFDVTLTGYSSGTNNFNDLIDTWRTNLAYRLQLARTRAQLGKATAALRAAAGVQ